MSDIVYKNVCLVCGEVMALQHSAYHLETNPKHVLVECMTNAEDVVPDIDINTSINGVTDTWGDVCHVIYASCTSTEQKDRMVQVINAGFITALKTKNFTLAEGIAQAYYTAGVLTDIDLEVVLGAIPGGLPEEE